MVNIHKVDVTFEVEGDDGQLFRQQLLPALERWYREVKAREREELESRTDRALMPPRRR